MHFGNRNLDHTFDPLKVVDIKTMASVAEALKKSNDKSKRAIGVFLDRVNRLRTFDADVIVNDNQGAGGSWSSTTNEPKTQSEFLDSSGLRDLQE